MKRLRVYIITALIGLIMCSLWAFKFAGDINDFRLLFPVVGGYLFGAGIGALGVVGFKKDKPTPPAPFPDGDKEEK